LNDAKPALEPPARPKRRARTWLFRIGGVLAGLCVGLVVAELAFRWRDHGAFPHLNVYKSDAELGVRLMPGTEENVSFDGNPVTHVRINDAGYRGADWGAPAADEVLVVGDSQVFGLGVEEDETFSAKLAAALGRPVRNGGVPTYGPGEYRAVIAEQLAARHPKTVVVAINLVNDLFEIQHPNKDRHAVWDGWAVRKELAPTSTTSFPGRDFLYRRSHLFFALRKWRAQESDEGGLPSEGTWRDAVTTGQQLTAAHEKTKAEKSKHAQDLAAIEKALRDDDDKLDELTQNENLSDVIYTGDTAHTFDPSQIDTWTGAKANPGDIVFDNSGGEEARNVTATAEQIRQAAAARAKMRAKIQAWAAKHKGKLADAIKATATSFSSDTAKLTDLDAQRIVDLLDPPLAPYIREVNQLVTAGGARLVVVVLPIDVQVSAEEWKKYGHAPMEMGPSRALGTEIAVWCTEHGISALDATDTLAAAEPGAFLKGDIHMTPKGHAAVAAALAKVIAAPAPTPALVATRSAVPVPAVWRAAPEVVVAGSSDANCETKKVREWLRIVCVRSPDAFPYGIQIHKDDGGDALAIAMPNEVSLLAPVVPGKEVTATITWTNGTRDVHVGWAGDKPQWQIGKLVRGKPVIPLDPYWYEAPSAKTYKFASPVEQELCRCWGENYGKKEVTFFDPTTGRETAKLPACSGVYGTADAACIAPKAGKAPTCDEEIRCMWRANE
jgi:hypothetical protein